MASLEGWNEAVGLVLRASGKTGFFRIDTTGSIFAGTARNLEALTHSCSAHSPSRPALQKQRRANSPHGERTLSALEAVQPRAPRSEQQKRPEAPHRTAPTASGAAAALQHDDGVHDAPHDRPRPEEEEEEPAGDARRQARVREGATQARANKGR